MALVLGIDGGGTRTRAVVASDSNILSLASGAASNVRTCGPEAATAAIAAVVLDSLASAGVGPESIQAVAAGVAGISRRQERDPVGAWLAASFPGRPTTLVSDVELVLAAAPATREGVTVVAGTGSVVFGRKADGTTTRSGGWGPIVGDRGSGCAIGRDALVATAEALDGMTVGGALVRLVAARTGATSAGDLGAGLEPSEIAALVPAVAEAADAGDPVARAILGRAGTDLARHVTSVLTRLGWTGAVTLALSGGVLVHVPGVRERLLEEVQAAGWSLAAVSVVEQPVMGAVALATELLDAAGRPA